MFKNVLFLFKQEQIPYFVELEVVNGADTNILTRSTPILLDTSEPSAGFVVDGLDYKMDAIYHGKQNEISGLILSSILGHVKYYKNALSCRIIKYLPAI